MTDEDPRYGLALSVFAGDTVLGTAAHGERAAILQRFADDPAFGAEMRAWERRLAPLAEIVPPVQPSSGLWPRILAETAGLLDIVAGALHDEPASTATEMDAIDTGAVVDFEQAVAARTRQLRRQVGRWRWGTLGLGVLAAGLGALLVLAPLRSAAPPTGQRYVAVVNASGETPPLLVNVDLGRGELTIEPLALSPPAGKSYQLWAVRPEMQPVSLGVVAGSGQRPLDVLPTEAWRAPGLVLAVSVEPEGGSPTGQPTGEVVYTGKLVQAD